MSTVHLPHNRIFGVENIEGAEDTIQRHLNFLAACDERYLMVHKETPSLLESGVRYASSGEGARDVAGALAVGSADADTLACWRVAELRAMGEAAEPLLVKVERPGGGTFYTCRVKRADGTVEDVVEMVRRRALLDAASNT